MTRKPESSEPISISWTARCGPTINEFTLNDMVVWDQPLKEGGSEVKTGKLIAFSESGNVFLETKYTKWRKGVGTLVTEHHQLTVWDIRHLTREK